MSKDDENEMLPMKSSASEPDPSFRLRRGEVSDLDSEVEKMVQHIDESNPGMLEETEAWDDDEDFESGRPSRWKWFAIFFFVALLIGIAALAANGQDMIALIRSYIPANATEF